MVKTINIKYQFLEILWKYSIVENYVKSFINFKQNIFITNKLTFSKKNEIIYIQKKGGITNED